MWMGTREEAKSLLTKIQSGEDITVGSSLIQVWDRPKWTVAVYVNGNDKTASYLCYDEAGYGMLTLSRTTNSLNGLLLILNI